MTRLEEVGRVRHLLQLRERLGLDTNPNPTTKTEKDVCNLAARASTSPVHMVIPPSPQTPIQDAQSILLEREYTQRERELLSKCANLIQVSVTCQPCIAQVTRTKTTICICLFLLRQRQIGYTKVDETDTGSSNLQVDASPGDEGCADMNMSYISTNSIEICSPDRIDMPNGWEAPAPAIQPVLPLRLYVPDLEEIRISPVVARKGR